jgi:hypothetical protein
MPDSPERSLTQSQRERLNAIIGQKLDDCLRDYEKIRKARAANPHGPTRPLELQRRQPDIEELGREGVRVYVGAFFSTGSVDHFRNQLESASDEFLTCFLAELHRRVSEEHWPFLNWAAIETALHDEVARWVGEKRRTVPVLRPWESADGNDFKHGDVATATGDKNSPELPPASGTFKSAVTDSPAPTPVGSDPDQKRGGRPPKKLGEETQRILQAWGAKGNPTLTRQVKDDIAAQIFSREYERTKSGSSARGKLLERIRKAIRRYG